jgi:hypothetical protein
MTVVGWVLPASHCLADDTAPYAPQTVKPAPLTTYKPKLETPKAPSTYRPKLERPRPASTYRPPVSQPRAPANPPLYRPGGPTYTGTK